MASYLSFFKKLFFYPPVIGVIIAMPALWGVQADPDLWWHIRLGLDHYLSGSLPTVDPYSFTSGGVPWINHSWGSDLIFGWGFYHWGEKFLWIFRGAIVLASGTFLAILFLRTGNNWGLAIPLLWVAFSYLQVMFSVRPALITHFLFLLTLFLCDKSRNGARWVTLVLPIILIVWANLHGGFTLGCILIATFFIMQLLKFEASHVPRWATFSALIVVLISPLINPYGVELISYILRELTDIHHRNTEWMPPSGELSLITWSYIILPLFLLALKRGSASCVTEWIIFIFIAIQGINHGRFIGMLSIISSLLIIRSATQYFNERSLILSNFLLNRKNLFVGSMLGCSAIFSVVKALHFGPIIVFPASDYPVGVTSYIKENRISGRLINPLQWGGFLLWHLNPQVKVALDGRNLTVYSGDFVNSYIKYYVEGDYQNLMALTEANLAVIRISDKLYKVFATHKDWKRVVLIDNIALFQSMVE